MVPKVKRKVDDVLLEQTRKKPCVVCARSPSDPAHILTRGSGGPDEYWNILPLCRIHHTEQHQISWFKMCEKYPLLKSAIYSRGFVFNGYKKLRRE